MANKITVSEQKIGDLTVKYDRGLILLQQDSNNLITTDPETLRIILDTVRQNSKSNGVVQPEKEAVKS